MQISPLCEVGNSRTLTVNTTYDAICRIVGFEPNGDDDTDKVEASWGFQDDQGRQGFLWCYKQRAGKCSYWSADGDRGLLEDLFGKAKVT